jgi:hypothetical protein
MVNLDFNSRCEMMLVFCVFKDFKVIYCTSATFVESTPINIMVLCLCLSSALYFLMCLAVWCTMCFMMVTTEKPGITTCSKDMKCAL